MSKTLAPGKQYVMAVLHLMFLIMESPIISEAGGGGLEVRTREGITGRAVDFLLPNREEWVCRSERALSGLEARTGELVTRRGVNCT